MILALIRCDSGLAEEASRDILAKRLGAIVHAIPAVQRFDADGVTDGALLLVLTTAERLPDLEAMASRQAPDHPPTVLPLGRVDVSGPLVRAVEDYLEGSEE